MFHNLWVINLRWSSIRRFISEIFGLAEPTIAALKKLLQSLALPEAWWKKAFLKKKDSRKFNAGRPVKSAIEIKEPKN